MKKIIQRICFVLFGIFLALGVLELSIRIISPQSTYKDLVLPYQFNCFEKGSYYWIKLKPNQNCLLKSNVDAFRDTFVKTNNLGLRNPEIKSKDKNTKRILFIGDSFTIGWGVDEESAYPRAVESILKDQVPNTNIETINAGLTASGPGYYYLYLKNDGIKLDPDVVVIGLYLFNDLPENIALSNWKDIDEDGLPKKTESTFYYVDLSGNLFPSYLPLKVKIPFLRQSHLFALLADKFDTDREDIIKQITSNEICRYKKECHDLDPAKEKLYKLLIGMKKITDAKNIKLIIALIPVEFQSNTNSRLKYIPIPLLPSEKAYPYQEIEQFFEQNHIDYLDLREAFNQHQNEQTYFKLDNHWNELGHKIAAEAIAKKLSSYLNP